MVDTVVHGSSGSDAGTPYPTVTLVELLYPTKVSPGSPEDKASLHSRAYEHRGMPCKELCHLQHTGSWWCQSLHVSVCAGLSPTYIRQEFTAWGTWLWGT